VTGITTTLPVEILFAAGRRPVDLNNLFVADSASAALVQEAERAGFPASCCAWIKGIYGAVRRRGVGEVIGVVEGDCSDTGALLEILRAEGVPVREFGFPRARDAASLEGEMRRLAAGLGTDLDAAEAWKRRLDPIRELGAAIDAAPGASGRVRFESLLALTDFLGDPEACRRRLETTLAGLPREAAPGLRLAVAGVPTILTDLWETLERGGAQAVLHEVPRQFALLPSIGRGLVDAYLAYNYPYDLGGRLDDLRGEIGRRGCVGVIHCVQSFCHRQLHDRLLRERCGVPVLTVEADRPGRVDERTRTRIEAFLERLGSGREQDRARP